jgi:hypothetical protein
MVSIVVKSREGWKLYIVTDGVMVGIFEMPKHGVVRGAHAHHTTRHNTSIHNILSTAPQLSISQKALGTLPEDGNVMPKNVGATIQN